MSKAVMISIQPKWCALIANGAKTVEVRKTRPKIETPFKCYIYQTKSGKVGTGLFTAKGEIMGRSVKNGSVIGEFVCDKIHDINYILEKNTGYSGFETDYPYGSDCLSVGELEKYLVERLWLPNGRTLVGYGWHISDLKIYDKPKKLSEFRKPCIMPESPYCPRCEVGYESISEEEAEFYRVDGYCKTEWQCLNFVKRPFQSWGYVEEYDV